MKGRTIACRAGSECWMGYTAAKLYRSAKQERSFQVAIPAASSGGRSLVVLPVRAGGYQRLRSARAGGNEARRRDCDRLDWDGGTAHRWHGSDEGSVQVAPAPLSPFGAHCAAQNPAVLAHVETHQVTARRSRYGHQ